MPKIAPIVVQSAQKAYFAVYGQHAQEGPHGQHAQEGPEGQHAHEGPQGEHSQEGVDTPQAKSDKDPSHQAKKAKADPQKRSQPKGNN